MGAGIACAECHTYPTSVSQTGHIDSGLPAEVPMNGSLARSNNHNPIYSNDATRTCTNTYCHGTATPNWNATLLSGVLADCAKCHACPPNTSAHTNITGGTTAVAAWSEFGTRCSPCHKAVNTTTSSYSNIFTSIALHIDGKVSVDCLGCHNTVKGSRAAAASQFSAQSHHVQGTAVNSTQCAACHWEANSDGTINSTYHDQTSGKPVDLVIWNGTRPAGTTYTEGSTGTAYTADGTRAQIAKINNNCLGCHTGGTFGTEPVNPFGDGKKPSQYAWDAKSIDERYSQTGTTRWSQYSTANTNKKKHLTKAYSPHGNAANNQMGWNTTTGVDGDITDITSNVNVACYDCHNSHGSNVAGKTVSYTTMSSAKYNGGIFKDISSSIGGYSVTYKPKTGGSTAGKNVYNPGAGLCFDCHNNRSAAAAKKPWGYGTTALGGTFGATAPLYGYWDTPYFGNYTFASVKRNTYKAGASNAMTANKGGHYGASSTLTSPPDTAHQIGGICTPCHDPHGVSPNTTATGINGAQQYAVPLLKGTWVTSPYKEDTAPINATRPRGGGSKQTVMNYGSDVQYNIDQNTFRKNRASTTTVQINAGANIAFNLLSTSASRLQTVADTDFAGLCTKCHSKANLTDTAQASTTNWQTRNRIHQTVEGWAATSGTGGNVNNKVHAYTCSKCHAPHNSRLPRLMVTNCLDMKHRGKVTSGGSVSSVAAGGTTAANTGNLHSSINSTGKGAGRFPSGGGRYTGTKSITSGAGARNPGPWMFGAVQSGSQAGSYTTSCHNTATSGGATYTPANQQWNTKTIW
jgi:predicted CxxxxCH...CXXCH cytochrome family protein